MSNTTHADIVIGADRAKIMGVIADLEQYPQWSEGVTAVEVLTTTADGRPGTARFSFASGPIKDVFVLKYDWNGDDSVSWELIEGKVLTKEQGTYALTSHSDGRIKVTYDLEVGLSIKVPGIVRKQAEKKIVNTALEGLKRRVEASD
ncbi:MAG: SRPBCC family protein [Actinomycetes bacterium]